MKKRNCLSFLFFSVSIIIFFSCASTTPTQKNEITEAKNIDFDIDPSIPADRYCYLTVDGGVHIFFVDNKDNKAEANFFYLVSGTHFLLVQYRSISVINGRKIYSGSKIVPIDFNAEAGKYYYVRSKVDGSTVQFNIEEINDPKMLKLAQNRLAEQKTKIEKLQSYLSYMEENPNRLEGTWTGKGKSVLASYNVKYTFNKNNLTYQGEVGIKPYILIMNGRLYYNENTIVFLPDKGNYVGKDEDFSGRRYLWNYVIEKDTLKLTNGGRINVGARAYATEGEFRK